MADTSKNTEETTPTTDKGGVMHPNGMNPHIVPEKAGAEESTEEV
jgi:hypothetical protein